MAGGIETIRRGIGFGPLSTISRGYLGQVSILFFCSPTIRIVDTSPALLLLDTAATARLIDTSAVLMLADIAPQARLIDVSPTVIVEEC